MEELAISFSAVRHKNTCSRRCFFRPAHSTNTHIEGSSALSHGKSLPRDAHAEESRRSQRTDRADAPEAHAGKPPLNTPFFD